MELFELFHLFLVLLILILYFNVNGTNTFLNFWKVHSRKLSEIIRENVNKPLNINKLALLLVNTNLNFNQVYDVKYTCWWKFWRAYFYAIVSCKNLTSAFSGSYWYFRGSGQEVGRSCHYLQFKSKKIMVCATAIILFTYFMF